MAYVKIETSVPRHRKFLQAGPAACWLWVCGLAYCQEGLTDGHIPAEALPMLGVPLAQARKLADTLVRFGLWELIPGGWRVHDYLDHNHGSEYVRAVRESRAAGGKLGGRPPKTLPDNLEGLDKVNLPENPSTATYTATATATPTPARRFGAGAMAGSLPKDHLKHAWCGNTYRVCVPEGLHGELARKLGGSDGDARIKAFYAEVEAKLDPVAPVPADVFKFWKAQFDARFAPTGPKPVPVDAAELERRRNMERYKDLPLPKARV